MPEILKRKLHALLVGIDQYETVRPLAGCVKDVKSISDYLQTLTEFDLSLQTLTSDQASKPTKDRIVNAFQTHFSSVEPGDVILFYFAGHGVREKTDLPAFKRVESDDCLATLVCYDTRAQSSTDGKGTTLSDKELRYLLHTYTAHKGAHVLVITDCCHSGGNTRNLAHGAPLSGLDVPVESLTSRLATPQALPSRSYGGFIFSSELSEYQLENEDVVLDEILPQGEHIHIAACRDVEEAWEARRPDGSVGGYFTITLLDILDKARGGISYYELRNRATSLMRSMKTKPQTPQIYASSKNPNEIYSTFLTGTPGKRPIYCNVTYNKAEGWTIDLGAIQGIAVNTDETATPVKVEASSGDTYKAVVKTVFPGYSRINFVGRKPDPEKIYRGFVEGAAYRPISVWLTGETEGISLFQRKYDEKTPNGENTAIQLVTSENLADYKVTFSEDIILITQSFDDKPLVEEITGYDLTTMELTYNYLLHISRWNFIHRLNHPKTELHKHAPSQLKMYPVEIQVFQLQDNNREREIDLTQERIELNLNLRDRDNSPITKIRVKITNHGEQSLYCCLVYMSMTFASYPTLLPTKGVWLQPGASAEAADGQYITVKHEAFIKEFGWDHSQDFIKLIMSTTEFDPMIMFLNELPKPRKARTRSTQTRMLLVSEPRSTPPKDDWSTKLVELYTNRSS